MNGSRRLALAVLAIGLVPGCQGAHSRRSIAVAEPGLIASGDSDGDLVAVQPPRVVSFADRHPLFSKPREYYANGGRNKPAKIAAATVVGVPAGIVGELRQIVVGQPAPPQY